MEIFDDLLGSGNSLAGVITSAGGIIVLIYLIKHLGVPFLEQNAKKDDKLTENLAELKTIQARQVEMQSSQTQHLIELKFGQDEIKSKLDQVKLCKEDKE
jgi:hypothetical protein